MEVILTVHKASTRFIGKQHSYQDFRYVSLNYVFAGSMNSGFIPIPFLRDFQRLMTNLKHILLMAPFTFVHVLPAPILHP
ncbi:hypothetical protein J3R30DRAFT_3551628 [Lentinula aciculospora]|uniref:Uncharacterized protein n=1 Tax=Lentinula aciculospora TaxID=153920 RepID=A0A9W9DGB3_9AGAR|nr:hypothetical protein J3R30DRAFT_3551628 [Lentinula aciculospora]